LECVFVFGRGLELFQDEQLNEYLKTSSSINSKALILAEWNLNFADNIETVGNYRFRPNAETGSRDALFSNIQGYFDRNDAQNLEEGVQFYTGATDADITIDGGFVDGQNLIPQAFTSKKEKEKQLYSLEECFGRFRPRSGINKARFFNQKFLQFDSKDVFSRPRYYMGHRDDKFKYWSSYRTESEIERGISRLLNGANVIDDTAPFVVYKKEVPANRIVVKMQTGVGNIDLGPFQTSYSTSSDPFFGYENQDTPVSWKIQYLSNDSWIDAVEFEPVSLRSNGDRVIGVDGHVEISYGLVIPLEYRQTISLVGEYSSEAILPVVAETNEAYLVGASSTAAGRVFVWTGSSYDSFSATYGWFLREETDASLVGVASELVNPKFFVTDGQTVYREVSKISGIRVVVQTMNTLDSTLELIEISPRLVVNMTDRTSAFNVTKSASDLGISGMPVGQLLASVGSISIFDYDSAFNENNAGSMISSFSSKNMKVKFFEDIVDNSGQRYLIPIKTLYAEGFPSTSVQDRSVSVPLRDLFFLLESMEAPELFLQNVSMTYAVSILLDSIGFSNYTFKRIDDESDAIIPFFFVQPGKTVAQVLQDIAVSTQTAMFFDEYNNFVMMTKNFIMPAEGERPVDLVLRGSKDFSASGVEKNKTLPGKQLANIQSISSMQNDVYNDGTIRYYARHIQRSYGSLKQSMLIDKDKSWSYKPVLLWEVSPTPKVKSQGDDAGDQSSYVLSAIPLNSDLSEEVPTVVGGEVINNIIEFGEGIYWLSRYNGYFYSNGEVIKYDAAEYSVAGIGDVWVSSAQEYHKFFSQVPFNGKMYPTGTLRIFSEPSYEFIDGIRVTKDGPVAKHGRGQFDTKVVGHRAGLDPYWSSNESVAGCKMQSSILFSKTKEFFVDARSDVSTGLPPITQFIRVSDITGLKIGLLVEVVSGPGRLSPGSKITGINEAQKTFVVDKPILVPFALVPGSPELAATRLRMSELVDVESLEVDSTSEVSVAGSAPEFARSTTRNGIIKNFLSASNITETQANSFYSTQSGTIQSSALVMQGSPLGVDDNPIDFISYVHKPLDQKFTHFGTRMRIVGRVSSSQDRQSPVGSMPYYSVESALSEESVSISGGSGGIAVLLNPVTNNGYYLELISLTENNVSKYGEGADLHSIVFYKLMREKRQAAGSLDAVDDETSAIPIKLWGGSLPVVVDDGLFAGQARVFGEENPSVYDLSVEYVDSGGIRNFYIYVNNKLVKVVQDTEPLPVYNNMGLFVRGTSRIMFENIFALSNNVSQNSVATLDTAIGSVFANQEITVNDSLRKYAMSGMVQSTYLSGVGNSEPLKYSIYFEEFGTIMREAAYFNVKYDRAYPALYAQISPTFNNMKGYTISGFIAGAYGAEFLIFNNTDTALNLDETTGNYLRIQGVAFTQQTQYDLTVDEYFGVKSNMSTALFQKDNTIEGANRAKEDMINVRQNRISYGRKEFSIDPIYIQSEDAANELMDWMISKTMSKKKSVGLQLFGTPTLQLGDVVSIDYKDSAGVDEVAIGSEIFTVYSIEYSRDASGPSTLVYLSEVA
jgi:hypothetical protein